MGLANPSAVRTYTKRAAFASADLAGINRMLLQRAPEGRVLVLCYHGVVSQSHTEEQFLYRNTVSAREFDNQLSAVCRWFTPVSADDLMQHFNGTRRLPRRPFLVTFDDGYRNGMMAAEILRRHGVPALFSLATSYIGAKRMLWIDEINLRVLYWPKPTIPVPSEGLYPEVPMPQNEVGRIALAERVRKIVKGLKKEEQDEYAKLLQSEPCRAVDERDEELFAFLSWNEVRSLKAQGFEIASHTVTHPLLTRIPLETVRVELSESKCRIQAELGGNCPYIVYPNGTTADTSAAIFKECENVGYRLGFVLNDRFADINGPRMSIERINVPGHQPLSLFMSLISGLKSSVAELLGGSSN